MGNTFYDRAESTELRCADLSGLDLSGANLSGACFRGAKLHGADFTDSIGGELAELHAAMLELPNWAAGFPIDADGWIGKRYRK